MYVGDRMTRTTKIAALGHRPSRPVALLGQEDASKVSAQERVAIFARVDSGQLTAAAAAALLELSERQVRRLLARYRQGGGAALQHGNRGRQPAHTIRTEVRQRVIALAERSEQGYTARDLSRALAELEGVSVSRSSVRRILLAAGLPTAKRAESIPRAHSAAPNS